MDRKGIEAILPHRPPMLLLDEVEKDGDEARGLYKVKGDEYFLQGHFPSFPVVPGVILCEILAQSACILMPDLSGDRIPVYAGLDKVRFKSPVRPGDEFRTVCRITKSRGAFHFGEGIGYVGGRIAIKVEFSFAIVDKDSLCSQKS